MHHRVSGNIFLFVKQNIAFEYFVKSQSQKKITLPKEKRNIDLCLVCTHN
jgi:hypothetical protein